MPMEEFNGWIAYSQVAEEKRKERAQRSPPGRKR
jgi:hypothetical protein